MGKPWRFFQPSDLRPSAALKAQCQRGRSFTAGRPTVETWILEQLTFLVGLNCYGTPEMDVVDLEIELVKYTRHDFSTIINLGTPEIWTFLDVNNGE